MTKILAEYRNAEDAMTACVVESVGGGFGVSLRDDDSGLYAPLAFHGFKTLETATAKAKTLVA